MQSGLPGLLFTGDEAANYEIIRYAPEFREQLLHLQQRSWGPEPALNARYLAWKYESNPFDQQALIFLARQGETVVGMRGFWSTGWYLDGEPLPAVCAGDLVVSPEHESQGLFRRIMTFAEAELRQAGYRYLLNLSASPVTYLRSIRSGWKSVQPWQSVRRETGPWATIQRFHQGVRKLPLMWRYENSDYAHKLVGGLYPQAIRRLPAGISESDAPRVDAMAALAATEAPQPIAHAFDRDYLQWRLGNPMSRYRYFYAGDQKLSGYLILQQDRRRSSGHCAIVDWRGSDPSVRRQLLEAVTATVRPAAISTWTAGRSEDDKALLTQAGFESVDDSRGIKAYRPSLLLKPLSADKTIDPRLLTPENWHFSMLFSDRY